MDLLIQPFTGLRPAPGRADDVAAPPYDVLSSDEARQQQAAQAQQHYDAKEAQQYARLEKQSRDYQRAMTACLEGRGYTVR